VTTKTICWAPEYKPVIPVIPEVEAHEFKASLSSKTWSQKYLKNYSTMKLIYNKICNSNPKKTKVQI
jgi:hypothetical protein